MARETHLVAVKVLDSAGFGTYASVIEGIQWAVVQATVEGRKGESVINMSLSKCMALSASVMG